jgi:hypothetical protein
MSVPVVERHDVEAAELVELVPPDLPPHIALARLIALAKTLLYENHRLRDELEVLRHDDSEAA